MNFSFAQVLFRPLDNPTITSNTIHEYLVCAIVLEEFLSLYLVAFSDIDSSNRQYIRAGQPESSNRL